MESSRPKKRPRGGLRQRLKRSNEGIEENNDVTSALALLLLILFAWGFFSPQRVQQIAEMAVRDIKAAAEDPSILKNLETLANLGPRENIQTISMPNWWAKLSTCRPFQDLSAQKYLWKASQILCNISCYLMRCFLVFTTTTKIFGTLQLYQVSTVWKSSGEACGYTHLCKAILWRPMTFGTPKQSPLLSTVTAFQ